MDWNKTRRGGRPAEELARLRCGLVAWEGLRVIYNLVMVIAGGIAALPLIFSFAADKNGPGWALLVSIGVFGLGANLCFCLGPLAETYSRLFLVPLGVARYALFGIGLLFSLGIVALFGFLFYFAATF